MFDTVSNAIKIVAKVTRYNPTYKSHIVGYKYTVNHKKRDILFLTITSANLNRFL